MSAKVTDPGETNGEKCCGHGLVWHDPRQGCGYRGFSKAHRCPCLLTFVEALAAHDVEIRKQVGERFGQWAAKNEIAEPPLDWGRFGEIVRWTTSTDSGD